MGRVIHFEIPVDDPQRARTFYGDVFGWRMDGSGDEQYWLATTGSADQPGVDGALIGRSELHARPVVVIDVTSVEDAVRRAQDAGAVVLTAKQTIPTIGYSAYLRDPEGNVIGIFQADEDAGRA